MLLKAKKYRIYPTKSQILLIEKHFGSTRFYITIFWSIDKKSTPKEIKKLAIWSPRQNLQS